MLISVGYAACHWCHVMAHESFEDEAGRRRLMNDGFVAIKVDREERPDVDAVYMTATQAMTGQGGWPMTVFATPDGAPFFCGTYFPRPNFVRLLAVGRHRLAGPARGGAAPGRRGGRGDRRRAGRRRRPPPRSPPTLLDAAAAQLAKEYDPTNGGFGGAPKFPPHMNLLFLLRHHQRTGDPGSLEIVRHTAEAMARGGIYDQLAGGFARYSVDAHWTVPHFEKMLYDNALLLRVYTQLWRLTGDPLARRVAPARPPRSSPTSSHRPAAGFASALDADTEGVEGLTYAWTPAQLVEVLGEEDGRLAADLFAVTADGHVRARQQRAAAGPGRRRRRPEVRGPLAARCAAGCSPPGTPARSRPATTRWWPPGTAWRSPPWPSSAGRRADRPRTRTPT